MKYLVSLLLLFAFLGYSCTEEPEENTPAYDDTSISLTSHLMLDSFMRSDTLSWTKAGRDDYQYSIAVSSVSSNDDDSIWASFEQPMFSRKGMTENRVTGFINNSRDRYLTVLVVKYPNNTTFKEWMNELDDSKLQNYIDITILTGDGDMPIGTGCGAGCCTTGSYTCPDGEHTQTCKCVNDYCWKKICGEYSKLEKIPEI